MTHHIAFAANAAYFPYLAVALKSFSTSQPQKEDCDWQIHVFTSEEGVAQKEILSSVLAGRSDVSLIVYSIDAQAYRQYDHTQYTLYAIVRALLPELLPITVKRVLYLDVDVLVLGDLCALMEMSLQGKSTGMVRETKIHDYNYIKKNGGGEINFTTTQAFSC